MKPYWFAFNPADWLTSKSVRMMSKAERGVYINLLALCWGEEVPGTLPAAEDTVRRMGEMSTAEWGESGPAILAQFPMAECGTFRYNPRLTTERIEQERKSEINAEAGRRSAEKRAAEKAAKQAKATEGQRTFNEKGTAVALNPTAVEKTATERQLITTTITIEQPMSDSATPSPDVLGFEVFWNAYGRKEGSKGKMGRQWNALPAKAREAILNGLPAYRTAKTLNGPQFMPMPQTFLNGKLWEAETFGHLPTAEFMAIRPATPDPETDRLRAFSEQQAQQPASTWQGYQSGPNRPASTVQEPAAPYALIH